MHKVFFQPANLLVEQVVGLVDEAERNVGHDFGGAGFAEFPIGLIGHMRPIPKAADIERLLGIFCPERKIPHAEEVLVVEQQFFLAGAGQCGQSE